jgi:hypothetical protein
MECEGRHCEADGERRSAPYLAFPRKRGKESISSALPSGLLRGINPFPLFHLSQPALRSRNAGGFDSVLGAELIYRFG